MSPNGMIPAVHRGVPDDVAQLIWDVFFIAAGRGVSIAAHLPWRDAEDTRSVVLRDAVGAPVAAAVIRPAPQASVAMIGFVCVAAQARGQGHARTLIAAANTAVDADGFGATLLWTGKPEVYTERGYAIVARDRFLDVARGVPAVARNVQEEPWPPHGSRAGLPAFASTGSHYRSARAEAIVVHGPRGATLLDWQGDPADVVTVLDAAGIDRWTVNLPVGDPLADALDPALFAVTVRDGAITMARRTDTTLALDYVRVADRI